MSYSLDDVLAPPVERGVRGSLIAWIVCGHVPWVVGLTWLGMASEYTIALVGACAFLAGILFALLAWTVRHRSRSVAVVVAWVPTTLLGVGSLLCAVAFVVCLWGLFTIPPADPNAMDDVSSIYGIALVLAAGVALIVAAPTIGGFGAAISLARDLRRS